MPTNAAGATPAMVRAAGHEVSGLEHERRLEADGYLLAHLIERERAVTRLLSRCKPREAQTPADNPDAAGRAADGGGD